MTGYDLKRHFDSSVTYFWSADKAQIYRTLASLGTDGLVAVESVPGTAGPARQLHRITSAGRATLHTWLTSELDPQPTRDAFLARVFFAADLAPAEMSVLLDRRREAARDLLLTLTALRAACAEPSDLAGRLRLATLDNGLRHARTELAWLEDLEKELR